MAQGNKKLNAPGIASKKEKNRTKKQNMKKGGKYIAPKKHKVMEQAKLKKALDKAIKTNIEQEITQKVKSVEAKAFKMVASPSGASSSKKPNEPAKIKMK
ncbi:UPF0390 protein zgc136864-like [Dreissena polymorpha]|uniref:Leydig cell tumor 10 kDa protein homolog n=1 Tax=Dreissena polymorpha TaxID=45954 RepID=A0A9D4NC29_DREPO|nr:UPF0390 protein zgc136864-like [Dreissena polymorpha]KAH3890944.1 hypothetical protein DPMN_015033 [Dreissena polymorpha]